MTEEKIKQLQELLHQRECIGNEIEALEKVFDAGKENLGFRICDTRQSEGYDYLHFIKDHFGYMDEALRKIYAELKQKLLETQKKIDEFL